MKKQYAYTLLAAAIFAAYYYTNAFEFSKAIIRFIIDEIPFTSKLITNFHTIQNGAAYRSKQPTADELSSYIDKYDIKTIINLRGKQPNAEWWQKQNAIAQQHNVKLIDIPIKGHKTVKPEQLRQIILALDEDPALLIHCRQGRDRSGLGAALYQIEKMGYPLSEAEEQLAMTPFGHIWFFYPKIRRLVRMWAHWRIDEKLSREQALEKYEKAVARGDI
jgi:hypothetical protein